MPKKISLLLIICFALLTGCQPKEQESAAEARQYAASDLNPRIVEASNAFGLQLYKALSKANPEENVWISPLSVSSALALASSGAAGTTVDEMAATLGLSKLQSKEIGSGYRVLLHLLNRPVDPQIRLSVANSIWMREGMPFHESFITNSRTNFSAELHVVDFSKARTVKQINRWVKDRTNGKINEIVKELEENAALLLLNAVYMKGAWTEPFRPESTSEASFHVSPAKDVPVQMMRQGGHYYYSAEKDYEAIWLPLGEKESANLFIFLPKSNKQLQALQEKLTQEPNLLTKPSESRMGTIALPRINLEYAASLNDSLEALGMKEAFDPSRASFSSMAPEPPNLYINRVAQKTYLKVDEEGMEAAAVTSVAMDVGAAPPENPFQMTVDRPFIVGITDLETDGLLFIGTVMNPNLDG